MKTKQSSKSSLFLIELIIAIFFFINAATICLPLFVKSHTISKETISINHAVLWTQNLAEIFSNQNGDYQLIKQIYAEHDCITNTALDSDIHLLLLFDADWHLTNDVTVASYCALSAYSQDDTFRYQDIYIMHYDTNILSATTVNTLNDSETLISHQRIQQFAPA